MASINFLKNQLNLEFEVLIAKIGKYGWDKTPRSVQDRVKSDWVDALSVFALEEVQFSLVQWVNENPNKWPNEGHLRKLIMNQRARQERMRNRPQASREHCGRCSAEAAEKIVIECGFRSLAGAA